MATKKKEDEPHFYFLDDRKLSDRIGRLLPIEQYIIQLQDYSYLFEFKYPSLCNVDICVVLTFE